MKAPPHSGKTYIISGASTGLGLLVAIELASQGANLLIFSRSPTDVARAHADIQTHGPGKIISLSANVAVESDVDKVFRTFSENFRKLDGIVSNAGIYGPMGSSWTVDWSAWKHSINTNLLGSVYFVRSSIPLMLPHQHGSIVQLSGGGATSPMPFITSYAASKCALVRFIESLSHELEPYSIRANTVAPGALNTRLLDEVLASGAEKVGADFFARALEQKQTGGADPRAAVKLICFLLSDSSSMISGRLISAVWDRWDLWPEYAQQISATDAFTLRRITGNHCNLDFEAQ